MLRVVKLPPSSKQEQLYLLIDNATSYMVDTNFWKGKKVFVTGHTGFKGAWLITWLNLLGAKVYGYALKPPTSPSLFEVANLKALLTAHYEADILDRAQLSAALAETKPEIVIHLAAQSLVQLSYVQPVETYAVNVMGTAHLLDAIRQTPSVRSVVIATSDKCYENKEWVWGYRETDPLGGFDPYSNSKACTELVTAAFTNSFFNPSNYATHGVAVATGRAGNVIGGGDWAANRLVPDCIRAFLKHEKVILRNPTAIRPWQHVLDPLHGYIQLAEKLYREGAAFSGAWNFGPSENGIRTVQWITENLASRWFTEAHCEVATDCIQGHEAHYLKLTSAKAHELLAWQPGWNIETTLEKIVAWTQVYSEGGDVQRCTQSQIRDFMQRESTVGNVKSPTLTAVSLTQR